MNVLRTATLTLATGLLVLAPVAADAASYIGQDTRSDVVTIDPDTGTMKPAPHETNGDILNSGVSHGAHRVTIATRFAALHPDDADGHVFRTSPTGARSARSPCSWHARRPAVA